VLNRSERACFGSSRGGQALIESCLVMAILALLLFGLFQISQLYAAKEIMMHSATAGARARAVGFNDFMIYKATRIAAIPTAGLMTEPGFQRHAINWGALTPGEAFDLSLSGRRASSQYEIEQSRIPLYLAARHRGDLHAILDYLDWDTFGHVGIHEAHTSVRVTTHQDLPLRFPMHRAFYANDEVRFEGDVSMDNHYPLYLQ